MQPQNVIIQKNFGPKFFSKTLSHLGIFDYKNGEKVKHLTSFDYAETFLNLLFIVFPDVNYTVEFVLFVSSLNSTHFR